MRYLNTAYVRNHRARIKIRKGALIISSPENIQRIPLEAIDALVLLGGAQVTSQALEACVRRGVRVSSLRMNGSIRFTVHPKTGGNVHLRSALFQLVSDQKKSLELSKIIVAAKIQNSRKVVERWSRDAKSSEDADWLATRGKLIHQCIQQLPESKTSNHVRGIEGDAARIYFRAIGRVVRPCNFEFTSRTRRPPRDPVNALLGFCYGLLLTECIGASESVGLDYQMGFFHRPRSGRPSLALDLIEEFRTLADRFVVALIRRQQISDHHFTRTSGGGVYLNDDGRTKLLKSWEKHKGTEIRHQLLGKRVGRWALPSIQSTLLARYLRGDLPSYPPFLLS